MPVTAPVSLSKIKTEFSGPNNFKSYVRGGSYVPNITANSAIATTESGLSMSSFLNASIQTVQLPQYNPDILGDVFLQTYGGPNNILIASWAAAQIILRPDGSGTYRRSNVNTGDSDFNFTWLLSGSASDYYAYLDTPIGDPPTNTPVVSSALDTALQLNSIRGWMWYVESNPPGTGTLTTLACEGGFLRIKNAGGTDLAAVSYAVLVSADSGGNVGP